MLFPNIMISPGESLLRFTLDAFVPIFSILPAFSRFAMAFSHVATDCEFHPVALIASVINCVFTPSIFGR